MADCRTIVAWAEATLPVPQPASPSRITKPLEHLDAMLPRRAQDDHGGELRTSAYLAMLTGQTDDALAFMVREACRRFDWFPTIKQLLGILAEWRAPQSEQAVALLECKRFTDEACAAWLDDVRDGQPIGDVPEQWCRIAVERGIVRRLADGSYVSRALYHGPYKAWAPEPRLATLPVAAPAPPLAEAA